MLKQAKKKGKAIVVCTQERGVFFGYAVGRLDRDAITLEDARMCVYWSKETRSVLGLAANGPAEGSRVGPSVPELELRGISAIITCASKAVERWEKGPWKA